ncbi:hypothetical protein KSP39_PZI015863 [Platanthera zijinensis]|uniref:Uncharacterized protein n=1 Tax=Platanthera zijinensis TaxID=2320716 RepID=A0AAP0B811_9ASPA
MPAKINPNPNRGRFGAKTDREELHINKLKQNIRICYQLFFLSTFLFDGSYFFCQPSGRWSTNNSFFSLCRQYS